MSLSRKKLLVATVVVLILGAIIYYYRQSQVMTVETTLIKRGDLVITVTPTETGTVDTDATALVKAEIAAQVIEVRAQEGNVVKAGDTLMRLDAEQAQAKLNLARSALEAARSRLASAHISLHMDKARTTAALAEAKARLGDAAQKYDKKKQLFDKRLIPLGEMETSEAELAVARAALNTAQANLQQAGVQERQIKTAEADVKQQEASLRVAQLNLDYTTIRAPMDGTVMEVPVKAGELVQPGTPVTRVTRMSGLYVKALVDEVDLSRLRVGQAAEIKFDTLPDKKFSATLFEVSPGVSIEKLKSRNVTVKLRLTDPPPFLRPGMSADVEIIVDTLKNILYAPAQTIMSKDKEHYVYVIEGGKVARRVITPGQSNWDSTEVRKGLSENERIITSLDQEGLQSGVRARQK